MSARADPERRITLPREPLRDGNTELRRWRADDVQPLAEIGRDPDIARWIPLPQPFGNAESESYLSARESWVRAGYSAPFAVARIDTGELLGSISLMRFVWADRRAEVGYWLGPAGRGAGHATRAVGLVCGWGFRELGLERVELLAATGNAASQAVAQRAGFTREALLRSYDPGSDGRLDMVCFGRLSTD